MPVLLTIIIALPLVFSHSSLSYTRVCNEIFKSISGNVEKLQYRFGLRPDEVAIIIDPRRQEMFLVIGENIIKTYIISTAEAGIGSVSGSNKTPPGTHRIVEKIGDGAKIGTVFNGRVNTGEIAEIYKEEIELVDDLVTTRIMRLSGEEDDINKGDSIDSYNRCIYIHGTPEEGLLGKPVSHGCIRMKNIDIIELYEIVPLGTLVEIQGK